MIIQIQILLEFLFRYFKVDLRYKLINLKDALASYHSNYSLGQNTNNDKCIIVCGLINLI